MNLIPAVKLQRQYSEYVDITKPAKQHQRWWSVVPNLLFTTNLVLAREFELVEVE
jgi:hypothetical protein